jgi:hypothetical protein
MPKPNYSFEKRQRELEKKRKKAEKEAGKAARKSGPPGMPESDADEPAPQDSGTSGTTGAEPGKQ